MRAAHQPFSGDASGLLREIERELEKIATAERPSSVTSPRPLNFGTYRSGGPDGRTGSRHWRSCRVRWPDRLAPGGPGRAGPDVSAPAGARQRVKPERRGALRRCGGRRCEAAVSNSLSNDADRRPIGRSSSATSDEGDPSFRRGAPELATLPWLTCRLLRRGRSTPCGLSVENRRRASVEAEWP